MTKKKFKTQIVYSLFKEENKTKAKYIFLTT